MLRRIADQAIADTQNNAPLQARHISVLSTSHESTPAFKKAKSRQPKTGDVATSLPLFGTILSALGITIICKKKKED